MLLPTAPPELAPGMVLRLLVLAQERRSGPGLLALALLLQPAAVLKPPALQRGLLLTFLMPMQSLSAAAADGMAMARPKSPSMACLPDTKTFSGLMSLCTKPCMKLWSSTEANGGSFSDRRDESVQHVASGQALHVQAHAMTAAACLVE
jgi:hypothetical protein